MGKLESSLQFTGTVGTFSAYRIKGSDKIYVRARRQKSGKRLNQLQPRVQENVSEFVGCVRAASGIRRAIKDIRHLADHNFTPRLTSLAKKIQKLDPVSGRGERNVLISQHPSYFAGFNLNKNHPFGSIIRHPLQYSIDAARGTANVQLPALMQGISLFLPWPVPQYRVIISLSLVADQLYNADGKKEWFSGYYNTATTGWVFSNQSYEGKNFDMVLPLPETRPPVSRLTYVLSIGIEMEITMLNEGGGILRAGAGKIIDLAAAENA